MYEDIKQAILMASVSNQKIAMFHFQVLKNSSRLEGVDAEHFCREVGVPMTYQTEFRKMISLARLMRQNKARLDCGF